MINNMNLSDDNLYHYVFHFNPYTKEWAAIHRNHYSIYWNDREALVLRNTDLEVLKQLVRDLPLTLFTAAPTYENTTKKED